MSRPATAAGSTEKRPFALWVPTAVFGDVDTKVLGLSISFA